MTIPRPDLETANGLRDWLRKRERELEAQADEMHGDPEGVYLESAKMMEYADALDRLLAERAVHAIPDGWKLVPVEPNHEMSLAAAKKHVLMFAELDRRRGMPVPDGASFEHFSPELRNDSVIAMRESIKAALAAAPQPKGPDDEA